MLGLAKFGSSGVYVTLADQLVWCNVRKGGEVV